MPDFKLSASLEGHDDDVSVLFPNCVFVLVLLIVCGAVFMEMRISMNHELAIVPFP